MDTNKISEYQYEHASLLLPWYITGKLTASEKEEVEAILELSPKLQQELAQQKQLAQMVHEDPEVLDIVAITTQEQRLDSLLERINVEQEQQTSQDSLWSQFSSGFIAPLIKSFDSFLQPLSSHGARVAFALFFVVQVAILAVVTNDSDDSPNTVAEGIQDIDTSLGAEYTLAEGDVFVPLDKNKTTLVLQFTTQTSEQEIKQLFQKIEAQVLEHPEGSTNYTVTLSEIWSEDEVDSLIRRLEKNSKMIRLVGRGL